MICLLILAVVVLLIPFAATLTFFVVEIVRYLLRRWTLADRAGRCLGAAYVIVAVCIAAFRFIYDQHRWLSLLELLYVPIGAGLIMHLVSWLRRRRNAKQSDPV